MLHQVVTAAVGGICLILAALLWVVAEKKMAVAIVLLVLAGFTGILGTGVSGWIHFGVTWFDHMIGSVFGRFTGIVLLVPIAITVAFIFFHDLWQLLKDLRRRRDGDVRNRTVAAAALMPITAVTIPGTVGALMVTVVGFLASLPAWGISALFGIH